MSLKRIASMVGTSVSTVSRVLNNTSSTCASKQLQDKIWAAAREIGYIPNETARSLQKTGNIKTTPQHVSIILARITSLERDPFFFELFRTLEIELFHQHVLIDQIIYAEESFQADLSHSDGVIIVGRCSKTLLTSIQLQNRNIVGIWRNPMSFDVDEVICDGKKAAELAMNHLITLGHTRIAYIGDCSFERRYVGYCDMLIKNDLPIDYKIIRQTDQTREEGELAFSSLLQEKLHGSIDFSAVLCANDITAISVLQLLKTHRRKLKQPISVISIDDIEESQNTDPFLTTVHIPRKEMAHMAVNLLLDRIAKEHDMNLRIEFPCKIIQRTSCYPNTL